MYVDYFKEDRYELELELSSLIHTSEERIPSTRVLTAQDVVGKTIKSLILRDQVVIIVFNDNSYYVVRVRYPIEIDEEIISEEAIYLEDTSKLTLFDLDAAGLATPELMTKLTVLQERRFALGEQNEEERERQEYERLKAKFEGE